MDIQTPKGQVTLAQERLVIDAFHKNFLKYLYVETNKDRDAVNDGLIMNRKTNTVVAVCETKCRGASLQQLAEQWNYEWLITHKKIKRNAFIAREMRVFFTGLLYLADSGDLLVAQLYDGNLDKWLVDYRVENTETQQTVNGGRIVRENAFVNMSNAKRFKIN